MRINKLSKISGNKLLAIIYLAILFTGIVISFRKDERVVSAFAMPLSKKVIVIDPGHGGWDPGMVATSPKVDEKDINLQISLKLQSYLEQGDCYVIMTRAQDQALGESKSQDMTQRKTIANTNEADLIISIHQNSFPQKSVKGAQAFYYGKSEKSKLLAECIQGQLKNFLGQRGKRAPKSNSSYYILKQTAIPSAIIECGFLSNQEEAGLLKQEDYQEKVAWAIYSGIVDYFQQESIEKS